MLDRIAAFHDPDSTSVPPFIRGRNDQGWYRFCLSRRGAAYRGFARSGNDRRAQAGVRRQSSLRDQPPLHLDDPLDQSWGFPGARLIGLRRRLAWPRVRWLFLASLCAITLLPVFLIAFSRVYTVAWLAVTAGLARGSFRAVEANPRRFHQFVRCGFPIAVRLSSSWGRRPGAAIASKYGMSGAHHAPGGAPNVLLIVLDTVAAQHLSLHGYTGPPVPHWSNWRTTASDSIPRRLRRRGPSLPMPQCSQEDGCTNFRWDGSVPLDEDAPHRRRVPRAKWLRDRGLRREYNLYCASDTGLDPRVHALRRFRLSRIHRAQDRRAGQSRPGTIRPSAPCCRGAAVTRVAASVCAAGLAVVCFRSQGRIRGQP